MMATDTVCVKQRRVPLTLDPSLFFSCPTMRDGEAKASRTVSRPAPARYCDRLDDTPPFCESAVTVNGPFPCTIHFTRTTP
jgi:hypothetical protein